MAKNEKTILESILKKNGILEVEEILIEELIEVVQTNHSQISITDRISLVKNIYLILSSSIQTLDAKIVDTVTKSVTI